MLRKVNQNDPFVILFSVYSRKIKMPVKLLVKFALNMDNMLFQMTQLEDSFRILVAEIYVSKMMPFWMTILCK